MGNINNKLTFERVTKCDLCGAHTAEVIDEKACVVKCLCCGFKYVDRRPTQVDVAENYDWSFEHCLGWGQIIPEAITMYQRRYEFMQRFAKGGSLLDVGAGLGTFLSLAQESGKWQCSGSETSHYAIEFAKKNYNLKLSMGQLEDLKYREDSFDALSYWHVLEHLPYPSSAMLETRRILKDKGFVFIAVPNDSWLGRRHFIKNALRRNINQLPFPKKLRIKKMYPEITEEGNKHLAYFTPKTLTKLLEKHGFKVIKRSIDFDYEKPTAKIEKHYQRDLLFCNISGVNFSNAILFVAQKE